MKKRMPTSKTAKPLRGKSSPKVPRGASASGPTARRRGRIPASRRAPAAVRAPQIYDRLHRAYPDAHCALNFESPYQLLVATILSAQCTDKRVNIVTPALFRRYAGPAELAAAKPEELEEMIKSTGFFRSKSKSLIGMATAIAQQHAGAVPSEMGQLVDLPGVGRKTANVILGNAFDRNEGIVVDTHVTRLSQRLALTKHTEPVKIEQDLMRLFPRDQWTLLAHLLIEHGRQICIARAPKCDQCVLSDLCPSSRV
jgi:endonuclease-3